jgi:hypothetical protein
MNNRKKKSSNNKTPIKKNIITRCRSKMIPVFESDTCEYFIKKEHSNSNNNCKNCKNSF